MEIPAVLPSVSLVELNRADARELLNLETRGEVHWARTERHQRDMDGGRWILNGDCLTLLAHPGTIDGAHLVNGHARLQAFLASNKRKLSIGVMIQNADAVGLLEFLGTIDQVHGISWGDYVKAQGVPHPIRTAGIVRTLHLLHVEGDHCLHPRKGGYSHSERWEYLNTLDMDGLVDCGGLASQVAAADVEIPVPQMGALAYAAAERGYGQQAWDFLTATITAAGATNPAHQIAVRCGTLRRYSIKPPEAQTWNPLVTAFHRWILGKKCSQSELTWVAEDGAVPLLPADVTAGLAVAV